MMQTVSALLALIVLIASLSAVYLVTKSKRVEASIDVLGQLVDTLTVGNVELRATLEDRDRIHAANRAKDKADCDAVIAAEREERRLEHLDCQTNIAGLQGKVDALTTNIAEVIAASVVAAMAARVNAIGETTSTSTITTTTTPTQGLGE